METYLDHRYKLLRSLGKGGMGQVWLTLDTFEACEVAVKVLTEQLATDPASVLQVKQEFRLMTHLQHPNCCEVYNYGFLAEGQPYFTMEVVPGEGLDGLLPCSPERLRPLLIQLLTALAYVHQRGYVHCDIKSENVRVRPDGTLKLMDFGLMLNSGAADLPIRGTLGYVAPEIIKRGEIDRRCDLYSVGCLAFELLMGALPFRKAKLIEMLQAHLTEPPPLPQRLLDEDGRDWKPILAKLLAKDPVARYQSAEDVLEDLGVVADAGSESTLLAAQLVGRDGDLARLQAALDRVERGEPGGAIVLHGAQGMGKTRLLSELRIRAQLAHLPFGAGGYHRQGAVPLAGVVAAVRALLPALREVVPDLLAELAPILAGVLPDMAAEAAPELDSPDKEKARLFDALARLLAGLARERGVVLAFDDWHWADSPSNEFLAYLLRNTAAVPLLVLLSLRASPETSAAPVWKDAAEWLSLEGLDAGACQGLIGSVLGTERVPAPFAEKMWGVSQGNPQLLIGALDHLVRSGTLQREARHWQFSLAWDAALLPANRLALLHRRLEGTSADARLLARVAAVAGAAIGLDELMAVAELGEEALFVALEALLEQQLVQRLPEGTYTLVDDALMAQLGDAVPAAELRGLHTRALLHLEGRQAALPLEQLPLDVLTRLARHAFGAEDATRAIHYALAAGRRSTALFANEEARQLLEPGLALVRATNAPELLPYLGILADVCRITARYDEALALYREAIALAEAAGDPLELARLLTSQAKLHMVRDRLDDALVDIQRALAECAGLPPGPVTLRALMTRTRALMYGGRSKEATALSDEALTQARGLGVNTFIAQALSLRGYLEVTSPKPDVQHGVELLQEACARFVEVGDRHGLYNATNLLGDALMGMGSYQEAWQAFEGTRELAFELGSKDDEAMAWLNLSITALEQGHLQEARDGATRTLELATALQRKFTLGLARAAGAVARTWLGEAAGAEQVLQEALTLAGAINSKYMEMLVRQLQIDALAYLGDFEGALVAVRACQALEREKGDAEGSTRTTAFEGSVLHLLGRNSEANPILAAGLARATAAGSRGDEARIRATLARLAASGAKFDEAEEQAARGLALANHIGAALIAAELHGIRGEVALATGRPAGEHYQAMERRAREAGAPLVLALALFGRAAAAPYASQAQHLVQEADACLARATSGLQPTERERFLGRLERRRLAEGNHIAFSLPSPARRRTPTGPLGLGMPGL